MNEGALALIEPKLILDRYLNGESTTQIAQTFGVTRRALNYQLLKLAPDEWKETQFILAHERFEDAKDAISAADDALPLARAREAAKVAMWELERVAKRIYGQDASPQVAVSVTIVHESV
jgi:Zn-dependent peptidase ImmA (M78 family)